MAEIKIAAQTRTEFGKGAARRIRRSDQVPAVLYGQGKDPIHVSLPGHDLMLALKNSNALLSIELESEKHLVIAKQVQRDPLKGFIEHADLLIVRKGEKVTVEVDVHVDGEAASDALVVLENSSVALEVEATHIPDGVTVSVADLEVGTQILAAQLELPAGAALAVDEELLIVNITHAPTAAEVEADLEAAEADAGIEHQAAGDEASSAESAAADGGADSAESE